MRIPTGDTAIFVALGAAAIGVWGLAFARLLEALRGIAP